MRFLITNDDGFDSVGISMLAQTAEKFGEVHIVAPAMQQSGISHRITFEQPLQIQQQKNNLHIVSGTPADCVRFAFSKLGTNFDWVLAGVNDGANLGVDIFYSGTVAAAREATFFGIPAIAFSQYRRKYLEPFEFSRTSTLLEQLLARFVKKTSSRENRENQLININLPDEAAILDAASIQSVECKVDGSPLPAAYQESPEGFVYTTKYSERPRIKGEDIDVCFSGNVAISYL